MTKDMTRGTPYKLILGFMLPLLAGMIFQQLYNLVDTMIVGQTLGVTALAGVGATGFCTAMLAPPFPQNNLPCCQNFHRQQKFSLSAKTTAVSRNFRPAPGASSVLMTAPG